jgi:Stress responsive A/B Barrel Domain
VVADFDDLSSYLAYRDHPAHRAVTEESIMPIHRGRACVQYEI